MPLIFLSTARPNTCCRRPVHQDQEPGHRAFRGSAVQGDRSANERLRIRDIRETAPSLPIAVDCGYGHARTRAAEALAIAARSILQTAGKGEHALSARNVPSRRWTLDSSG